MKQTFTLLSFFTLFSMMYGASTTTINGLPATVAVGDTILVYASGAVAPYTWSSSNPSAVSVVQLNATDAKVVVHAPTPSLIITAFDFNSLAGNQTISSHEFSTRIPDISYIHGDTAEVPVYYTDRSSSLDFLAADVAIPYDTAQFKFIGVTTNGTMVSGMNVVSNQVYDTVKLGIAATYAVPSAEDVVFLTLKFISKDTVIAPVSRTLHFTKFLVNEVLDGAFTDGILTVNPIPNYPPVFTDTISAVSINENSTYNFTFAATDANGHTVHYFLTMNPAPVNEASIDSVTGQFTFSPSYESANEYVFQVTANDGFGQTTDHQFTITVNNVNRIPSFAPAFPDTFYVREEQNFSFDVDANDPDLDPVYFSLQNFPAGMTIDTVTGSIGWIPSFTSAGIYNVTVEGHDLFGGSVTHGLVFAVADSNRAPVYTLTPNDTAVGETVPYSALISANDADGDVRKYFIVSGAPSGYFLDSLTGAISYTPTTNDSGTYAITLVTTDHKPYGTTEYSYTLTVLNFNQSPVIDVSYPDTVFIAENEYYSHLFTANDPDGDTVKFHLFGMPGGMAIDSTSGLLEWTPEYSQSGIYVPKIKASDSWGGADIDSLVFVVNNTNRSPVFSVMPDTFFIAEGVLFSFPLAANDPDNDDVHYSGISAPAGMTVDSNTGVISWTPSFNAAGFHPVTFFVTDIYNASDSYSSVFAVMDSNRIPILVNTPNDTTIMEGETYSASFTATDADTGDILKYYVQSGQPPLFILDSLTGAIQWTPGNDQEGVYPIDLVVTDNNAFGTATHSFTITVTNVNLSPVISNIIPDTIYLAESIPFTLDIEAADPDGDSIKFYVYDPPAGMTIDSLSGIIQWTPSFSQAGVYNPTFKVIDSLGASDSAYVVFIVINVNRPPVMTSNVPDTTINEGQLLNLTFTASDPDLDSLTFYLLTPKPGLDLSFAGALQWQPSYVQAGVETLIVMVSDGMFPLLDSIIITIQNINNPPSFTTILNDTSIARFDTLRFNYAAYDSEGDSVHFSLLQSHPGASISASGYFQWLPPMNAAGNHTFVVQAADSIASVTDTVVVKVIRFGDVSGNGAITSFDAGLILRDQVNAITLTPLQVRLGNVSGDTTISATDASLILQYVVALIDTFPGGLGKKMNIKAEPSAFAFAITPSAKKGEYDLIVSATKPSNVYGITMSVGFDSTVVIPVSIAKGAITDSMVSASYLPKGKANLALAGTKPLNTAGEIARLTFKLSERDIPGDIVLFTMKKFVLNEKEYANDIAGIPLNVGRSDALPTVFALGQNYPNPFNPATTINYQLPKDSKVIVTVYNLLGQEVKALVNTDQTAGYYTVTWNGTDNNNSNVSSGVYLYKIIAQSQGKNVFVSTKKMLLLK